MNRVMILTLVFLWVSLTCPFEVSCTSNGTGRNSDILSANAKTRMMFQETRQHPFSTPLRRLFRLRKFRPNWISGFGLQSGAMTLLEKIYKSDLEGLSAEKYHVAKIDTLQSRFYHNEEAQIENELGPLISQNYGYGVLSRYFMQYLNILNSGGWPQVAGGPDLKEGDRSWRVAALRSRLAASKDLDEGHESDEDYFDENLNNAVRRFQTRHGLEVDGIVGMATRKALNVPVEERIKQIKVNIERRRWLPKEFGARYILINIPDFKLIYVENEKTVLTMKVIVGRESRPTPILASEITSVELNPYWQIPVLIARKDIVPKIIEDPGYLSDANIRIFNSWEKDASEINQKSINWLQIKPETFSFKLRQEPGPSNALGQIKFIFPNNFQVYLHDTPARGLFQKTNRSSSSGCIRIEKPLELAKYLFRSGQGWSSEKIIAALNSGKTQILRLPESVPIYVLYWTAWVDDADMLNFRKDIYGRDEPLFEAFKNCRPAILSHKEDIHGSHSNHQSRNSGR